MNNDDNVGYRRPPTRSRFTKGKSGNPSGRPKTAPSLRSDLAAELQQPHEVFENGVPIKVSRQRAAIKSLTEKAIVDMRAMTVLLAIMRHYDVGTDEPAPEIDIEDLDQLEAYVANERKRLSQLDSSGMPNSDPDSDPSPNDEDRTS